MHELAITKEIISTIRKSAKEESLEKVTGAQVIIGKLTTFMKEPILYYFDVMKKGEGLAECVLNITEEEGAVLCNDCGKESSIQDPIMLLCGACESANVRPSKGSQIIIKNIRGK